MTRVSLIVNGMPVSAEAEPRVHLGDFLRSQAGLTGTHLGCEHGVCGACTVLLDGKPVRSCITFAVACEGRSITTVEGYDEDPVMARLRASFSKYHALQCGYCTPGMLATSRDIVLRLPNADESRVRLELSGNLCRCTGYVGIVGAIMSVLAELRETPDPAIDALRPKTPEVGSSGGPRAVPGRPVDVSTSPLFAPAASAAVQSGASTMAASTTAASTTVASTTVASTTAPVAIPEPLPAPTAEATPVRPAPAAPEPALFQPQQVAVASHTPQDAPASSTAASGSEEPITAIAAFMASSGGGSAASKAKSQAAAPATPAQPKGTQIEAMFEVAADAQQVWNFMIDLPQVAACLPGANIEEIDGDKVKGRIAIKFGPMNAAFAGAARLERDDASRAAVLRGAGQDSLSQSRATGDVHYRLESASPGVTTVHVALIYTLQGPLAQFSRSGLVQDFVRRMVVDFGANVNARLQHTAAGDAPPPPVPQQQSINPVSIMFSLIWRKFLGLFGRR